jgi:VanZ family protein
LDSTSLLRSILQAFFAAGISGTSLIQDFSSFAAILLICKMLIRKLRPKLLAIAWLLFISVLFFLPGSSLPKEEFFLPHFDKYVHFGFFAVLVFLWRFYFPGTTKFSWLLLLFAFCYGVGVEAVQHFLIAYRSYDVFDVVADMSGAVIGLFLWQVWYKKNRPL